MKNGKGKGSAPVCWDCKARIPLDCEWVRFAPEVVMPPNGVTVCGPSCEKAPPGAQTVRRKEIAAAADRGR